MSDGAVNETLGERHTLRQQYAERARSEPWFRWRYYRRMRRERRADPSKHMLLIGAFSPEALSGAVAGRPELHERSTRTLPDGRLQYIAAVLDYNP